MSNETSPHPEQAMPMMAPGSMNDSRRKSPFLAGLLSVMPGLGQVYVGYYQRGFLHAVVVATLITTIASARIEGLIPMLAIFLGFFWLYNIVDASRRATLYNEVLAGRTDIELPQDLGTPGLGGSVVGGLVIAAIGTILLLNTRFDVSLDWLEEWWPASLILFGLYLVYKARKDAMRAPKAVATDDEI
jgi:TM2 domain-containing membrane protein YozV